MVAIEYVAREQARSDVQAIYDAIEKQAGDVLGLARLLAHNPSLLRSFLALNTAANNTQLDPGLRDLAYLKTSQINQCNYCAHYHRLSGLQAGLTEEQIQAVGDVESDVYDSLQKDVLRYAEQVTRNIRPEPSLLDRLKEHLSDAEIMELTFTVGLANLTNRFNVALATDLP